MEYTWIYAVFFLRNTPGFILVFNGIHLGLYRLLVKYSWVYTSFGWNVFMKKHQLHLLNVHLGDSRPQEVSLPIRNKKIWIRPGDTHHHIAGGSSRAIDLIGGTVGVNGTLTLHNSLHCTNEGGCALADCADFTYGDHFYRSLLFMTLLLILVQLRFLACHCGFMIQVDGE